MPDFPTRRFAYPIYYPYLGVRIRGAVRGVAVFKYYWYGQRVDPLYYPYNPRTEDQQAWREYLKQGVINWQGFNQQTKDTYNNARYPTKLTGYARYLKRYLKVQTQYR